LQLQSPPTKSQGGSLLHLIPTAHDASYDNSQVLGSILYTHYAYPFELAGTILLVAIVAAISLSLHGERDRKVQRIKDQVAVKSSDRLRMVKMKSEKK